jgi:hypothetical protein
MVVGRVSRKPGLRWVADVGEKHCGFGWEKRCGWNLHGLDSAVFILRRPIQWVRYLKLIFPSSIGSAPEGKVGENSRWK